MTPKEKAEELVLKYLRLQEKDSYNWFHTNLAKQCALITVDEITSIKLLWYQKDTKELDYWKQVKQEIENL